MKHTKSSRLGGLIKKTSLAMIAGAFVLSASIAQADIRPAVVYDAAGKNDKSFNEAVYNGVVRFMNDTGIAVTELEPTNEAQMEQSLMKLAQRGYSPIVAVGFTFAGPLTVAAEAYPDTSFTLIDMVVGLDNVQNVIYKEHEGSFLVGVLAAMNSKTGTVGFVGGMGIPLISRFECGYKQGVKWQDSSINILAQMTGSTYLAWNNPSKGGEITRSQVEAGADVVYAAAGGTGIGVLQAAADAGIYGIGVDTNQNWMHPGSMLTSMLKRLDLTIFAQAEKTAAGTFEPGIHFLGLADGMVGYAIEDGQVTAEMQSAVEAASAEIVSGAITVADWSQE